MGNRTSAFRNGPRTLAIDVGGTELKASVLDRAGKMLVDQARVATPYGYGHGGVGVIGIILIIIVVLMLLGRI